MCRLARTIAEGDDFDETLPALADIKVLQKVDFVMKDGRVVKL